LTSIDYKFRAVDDYMNKREFGKLLKRLTIQFLIVSCYYPQKTESKGRRNTGTWEAIKLAQITAVLNWSDVGGASQSV
jgi:hypothetical protein